VDEVGLVRAARSGDREAFMQLVQLHQAGVRAPLPEGCSATVGWPRTSPRRRS
jgi:hypothetical protein